MKLRAGSITAGIVAAVFLFAALAPAAIPRTMNYQGYLTNSGGSPVNGTVNMAFRIYDTATGGTPLWEEILSVDVSNGVYSVILGNTNLLDIEDTQCYLGITVEADPEMTPRQTLTSVPYAMRTDIANDAYQAQTAYDLNCTGCVSQSMLSFTPGSVTQVNSGAGLTGGPVTTTGTLSVDFAGNGAASTVARSDHNHDALYVNETGDTMSGALAINQSGGSEAVHAVATGTGKAGYFEINNVASPTTALYAWTNGSGHAIFGSTAGGGNAIHGFNSGSGNGVYGFNFSGGGNAVYGDNEGTGNAGRFRINNTTSNAETLYAATNGGGIAVYGYQTGTGKGGRFDISNSANGSSALEASTNGSGSAFSGSTTGTGKGGFFRIINGANTDDALAATTTGRGRAGFLQVNNTFSSAAALYATTNGNGAAVWGYSDGTNSAGVFQIGNTGSPATALVASTNGNGTSVVGSTGGAGRAALFLINNAANTSNALQTETTGTGYSGYFQGGAGVYVWGNLNVTGTKNFVQPHPTDPSKQIAYVAVEAPESAVIVRGKAKLVNGKAVIDTPEHFRVVAGMDEDITVQFTPRSAKSKGLAAVAVSRERISVEELMEGKGTYEFDYFITAKRAGFEKHEPLQPNKSFSADMRTKEEFERQYAKTEDMGAAAMRNLLISNGILTKEGKLNMEVAEKLGWKLVEEGSNSLASKGE